MTTGTALALVSALLAAAAVVAALPRRPRLRALPPAAPVSTAAAPRRTDRLRVVASAGAAAAVVLVLPLPWGPPLALLTAALVWRRSRTWQSRAERRDVELLDADLPWLVELVAAAVAAGAPPGTALRHAAGVADARTRTELGGALHRLALGGDPVSVWRALGAHPQLGRLGRTLQRAAESGAPVESALHRLADDLRAQRRSEVETRARQVEVRATAPLGVCLLPAFVLIGVVPLVAGSALGVVLGR